MPLAAMHDDMLLQRFHALRADGLAPGASQATPRRRRLVDDAAERAAQEASAMQRLADGLAVDSSSLPDVGQTIDDDLVRRVQRLKEGPVHPMHGPATPSPIGDNEVQAFLAQYRDSSCQGEKEAGLARDARRALRAAGQASGTAAGSEDGDDVSSGSHGELDSEMEEDIVARALAEASLETEQEQVHAQVAEPLGDKDQEASFSLPSLPTHEPRLDGDERLDDELQKRMDLLLGLSGPTTRPGLPSLPKPPTGIKREAGQGWNLPGYNDARDADIDSWCCICNKDAELQCVGCDNDLYCTECWSEGHEFEKHRVKQFNYKRVGASVYR